MNRLELPILRAVILAASLACGVAVAQPLDLKGLGDRSLACQDFDEYVNGRWREVTPIPPDRARIGSFDTLRDQSRTVVEQALQAALSDPSALDTPGKRLVTRYYASGMDLAAIERRQLESLQPLLRQIDALADRSQLPALLAQFARVGIAAPLAVRVDTDAKDRRRYLLALDQGGLGLPDRDDYFRNDPRTLELQRAYEAYRLQLATLAGDADNVAAARGSMDLQQQLAAASQTRLERRDPNALYQINTLDTLAQRAPGLDWRAFFAAVGVPDPGSFNVMSPAFVTQVARSAAEAPLAQWRSYLRERLLDEMAPTLPSGYVAARFTYRERTIRGLETPTPRSEQVIFVISGQFGSEPLAEGLGQLYIARAFSPEAKARALQMVDDIKASLRARIERLDWMAPSTKQSALRKLDAMVPKIGYPDRWRTYDGLSIGLDDFSGNWLRARSWYFNYRLADLGQPVDRTRWFISPHLVNAFAGSLNEIVFPAAILQPPFFWANADPAVNFGGIGSVIGHEITHHFDDRGRQFDRDGNMRDWWTAADAEAYKAHANRLAQQYSAYIPIAGETINGLQTLSENISDLAGVTISYAALQRALARNPVAPIDGLTEDQRFFVAFATIWRVQYRPAALMDALRTDSHSPGRWRLLGTLTNLPEFAAAFSCPANAPMLRPAADRVTIW